jgi:stage V sporulation protein G
MITITAVKVILHTGDRIRGYATITIDDSFVVRGIKIIEGDDGHLFTAMPSRKRGDGTFQDIAHPISPDSRMIIEKAVQAEYLKMVSVEVEERFFEGRVPL